jgi:RimJ/RimL family protein N-acetyltransferase
MGKVVLRPATRADFDKMLAEPLPYRVRAFAVEREGDLLGVGGLGFMPDGTVAAFVHTVDGAHRYKVAMHKAGLVTMAEARRLGLRRVVASADPGIEASGRWLERLGFEPTDMDADGHRIYVWNG